MGRPKDISFDDLIINSRTMEQEQKELNVRKLPWIKYVHDLANSTFFWIFNITISWVIRQTCQKTQSIISEILQKQILSIQKNYNVSVSYKVSRFRIEKKKTPLACNCCDMFLLSLKDLFPKHRFEKVFFSQTPLKFKELIPGGHPLSTYAKFSEKLTF